MKTTLTVTLLLFCFVQQSWSARAPAQAQPNIGFIEFVDNINAVAERYYFNPREKNTIGLAHSIVAESKAENPWRFRTDNNFGMARLRKDLQQVQSNTALEYRRESGFSASIEHTQFNSNDYALADRFVTQQSGFRLRQEVIKSGADSPAIQARKFEYYNALGRLTDLENEEWRDRGTIQDAAADFVHAYCGKLDLEVLLSRISKSVKVAEVQKDMKNLSTRDYLRFKALETSLSRRLLDAQQLIDRNSTRFLRWGPEMDGAAAGQLHSGFDCAQTSAMLLKAEPPKFKELIGKTDTNPVIQGYDIDFKRLEAQFERIKIARKPSLEFYAGVFNLQRERFRDFNEGQIGFTFTYTLSDAGFEAEKKRYVQEKSLTEVRRREYLSGYESMLNGIYSNVEQAAARFDAAKVQLEQSEKLLKLLETQQELGMLDATAFTSAYLDHASALESMRSIWFAHALNTLELRLIERHSKVSLKNR